MTQVPDHSLDVVIDPEKFTKFPNWIFQSQLRPCTRMVYLVLLSYDWHGKRLVWPSVQVIADKANVSVRTVHKSIHDLKEAGLISAEPRYADVDQRTRMSNQYVLHELSQRQLRALCGSNPMTVPRAVSPASGAVALAGDAVPDASRAVAPARDAHEVDEENQTKVNQTKVKSDAAVNPASPGRNHGAVQIHQELGGEDNKGLNEPGIAEIKTLSPVSLSSSPGVSLRTRLENHQ